MRIIAFDLSLTATGYAVASGKATEPLSWGLVTPPPKLRGLERLQWIRDCVLGRAEGAALVLTEGYSYGSPARAHPMGELGGVVRLALLEAGLVGVIVPPACRAKYATGKGNAPKDSVLAEAIRRLGYAGHDHNEADALWMLMMAGDQYDAPWRVALPQGHRDALAKLDWPVMGRVSRAGGT